MALLSLSTTSTGRYRCEVSGEAHMFATDTKYGDLLVVVGPENGPTIKGAKERYSVGNKVMVNCTMEKTKPAANLSWYINNHLVGK